MNTPIASKGIIVSYGADATATTKLYSILTIPELEGAPESLDVTTLSDEAQVAMPGLPANEALEFSGLRGKFGAPGAEAAALVDEYAALRALDPSVSKFWKVAWPDGSTDTWQGYPRARSSEAEVNSALKYALTIIPATKITTTAAV